MLGREDDVRRFLGEQDGLASAPGVHGISLMWHAALSSGQVEMVRWIMARGANDASVRNFQGQTALEAAEARGSKEIADFLRERAS